MDLTDPLQSLLELLLKLKLEFAFIKDLSKVLVSYCFSSPLESALHQNLRILDIKFSANAIVPFTSVTSHFVITVTPCNT